MGDDQLLNLQPGTVVNGRYEIVKCLGAGSMGMVYACRHKELGGHLVAMKVLFSEVARDSVAAARFRNEIVASYGVNHPNVVRAYEYFRDGDLVAFTMEYVSGGDLADRISMGEGMPIPEVVRMLTQMALGVQAIHNAGIVHRDLKPENIMLTAQGDIKITDFGIAKTTAGPRLTEHGGVVGTIDYVSPEYLEKGQVDERSDIYALGVMAYEMVTGETPFRGKSVIETMTMRLKTDPPAPHTVRADCPVVLSDVVQKSMARDPLRRYQTAGEIAADLQSISPESLRAVPSPMRTAAVGGEAEEAEMRPNDRATVSRLRPLDPTRRSQKKAGQREQVEPLESVLRARQFDVVAGANEAKGDSPASKVSISQPHLSVERIRALSSEMYPEDNLKKTLFWCILFIIFGFMLCYLVLKLTLPAEEEVPVGSTNVMLGETTGP